MPLSHVLDALYAFWGPSRSKLAHCASCTNKTRRQKRVEGNFSAQIGSKQVLYNICTLGSRSSLCKLHNEQALHRLHGVFAQVLHRFCTGFWPSDGHKVPKIFVQVAQLDKGWTNFIQKLDKRWAMGLGIVCSKIFIKFLRMEWLGFYIRFHKCKGLRKCFVGNLLQNFYKIFGNGVGNESVLNFVCDFMTIGN